MPLLTPMNRLFAYLRPRVTGYGYDAVEDKKLRRPPRIRVRSEDKELDATQRKKLVATSRDLPRNYAIAAWMIRKHLDYVSTFGFQARTTNKAFNARLEAFVRRWSRRENFDVAGRHTLHRFTRLAERSRTLEGDMFPLKLSSGRVQAIEGDRIRTPIGGDLPPGVEPEDIVHGVLVTKSGRAKGFCLNNRKKRGEGFEFDRIVPARHLLQHAYFDRFDQVRGVGLIAPGINALQDTYEGLSYALAKAKVTQLWGMKVKRKFDEDESIGEVSGGTDENGDEDKSAYTVNFGDGVFQLDLDAEANEDADFMESRHPSTEFKEFTAAMIGIGLKSVDIPYSFYDESFTNFAGNRQAWLLYDQGAENKRSDNRELLTALTVWRIGLAIIDGELELPKSVGESIEDINFEWIARGIPWVDPLKDIKADDAAVKLRITSRQRVSKRRYGEDWFEVMDELDAEEERIQSSRRPMAGEDTEEDEEEEATVDAK